MNRRTGLVAALVAAIVSAAITAGGLLLFQNKAAETVQVANGQTASKAQVEAVIASYLSAHPAGINLDNGADRKRLVDVVHSYLVRNPEILVDMSTELDKRQKATQDAQQKQAIGKDANKLFRSPNAFVAGNPKGDVTVVEFFDYNCGFCKRALPEVVKLTESDPHVRLVLKELPIFGQDSEDAARVALASMKQGKYFQLHQKLFTEPGKADAAKALRIAQELGLDVDQIKKDMHDPSIDATLKENLQLAQDLGLQGTPLYLVGDQTINGAPDDLYNEFEQDVAKIRQHGCTTTC